MTQTEGRVADQGPEPALTDPYGRDITYLRVSVTDRCDFRCVYCMSEAMTFLPKADLLTLEELDRLCSAFIDLGVINGFSRTGEQFFLRMAWQHSSLILLEASFKSPVSIMTKPLWETSALLLFKKMIEKEFLMLQGSLKH